MAEQDFPYVCDALEASLEEAALELMTMAFKSGCT